MTWQVWFQSDFDFDASIHELNKARLPGYRSITHPGIYCFNFPNAKGIQYEITTKSKLSISYKGELDDYKTYLKKVQPFLKTSLGAQATKFDKYKSTKNGKLFEKGFTQLNRMKHKVEAASPSEVTSHLDVLEKAKVPDVLLFRLGKLDKLARSKRIAHHPIVLTFLENALNNPKYREKRILAKLIRIPEAILGIENYNKFENHQTILKRIHEEILDSIVQITEKETNQDVLLSATYFLKLTNRKESVNALFQLIERLNDEVYNNLWGFISEALHKEDSVLRKCQGEFIDKKFDESLISSNQRTKERVRRLSRRTY